MNKIIRCADAVHSSRRNNLVAGSNPLRRKRLMVGVTSMCLMAGCTAIVISGPIQTGPKLVNPVINNAVVMPSARTEQASPAERPEVEVITARPDGFEPEDIKRPTGPFLLIVANRKDFNDMELRLNGVAGERLSDIRLPKARASVDEVIDLPPGSYVLTDADHPERVCRITITPR